MSAEARRLGMGVLVDIVPNHVGVATPSEDPWWWDVLRLGRASEHASAFDVDWAAGDGRIRIPVIGDDDEDAIRFEGGEVRYHDQRFPVAPGTTTLEEQHYELVNWRTADDELNYRRFFAVNTLAAVRVEDPEVFSDTHVEIKRWFDEGLVDGLRVDHPDGLRDPKRYLDDLAALTGGAYVLVEKILEPGEELSAEWATSGTTGYDALVLIDRLLTDPAGEAPLTALENRLRGAPVDWQRMVHDNKRAVADGILHSEVLRITREVTVYRRLRSRPDEDAVADAIGELLACFPVYRSYLPEGRHHLDEAFFAARTSRPDLGATLDLVEPVLNDEWGQPARRFQQTSGMVMAKGVEDCSFYQWSRLTSLNEVGGDPSVFTLAVDGFHDAMTVRQRDWPDSMTTLSTHDTKRGEDVRARITALAEDPAGWEAALDELLRLAPVPDPGFGSLLWQAVLGAWTPDHLPDLRERLHGYAEKAMREAGDRTTWTEPDEAYEAAVHAAVDAVFESDDGARGAGRPGHRDRCGGRVELPRGQAARADDPGRARRLPGQRALGDLPRRPRQPSPGRLRAPRRRAGRHGRRRRRGQAPRHLLGAHPATRAARAVHRLHPRRPRPAPPPTTWWPTTAVARSPSSPGSRPVSPPRAAGAAPCSTCPTAAGTTC